MDLFFQESHRQKRNCVFIEKEYRFLQKEGAPEELEKRLSSKGDKSGAAIEEKRTENVDQANKRDMIS